MKVSYIFLQPCNTYTIFDSNKVEIDTYFPNGLRENLISDLNKLGAKLITDENEAISLGLNIFED